MTPDDSIENEKDIGVSVVVLLIYLIPILISGSLVLGVTSPQTSPFGAQRLAVIPVYFDDQPPVSNISALNDKVFTDANEHIQEISFGMTWLEGRISGWVHLSMNIRTYGKNESFSGVRLAKDAVAAADHSFDFSSFDRVVVVHSGPSWQKENSSYPSTCWVPLVIPTNDGVTFTEAIIVSEGDPSYYLVHELCHGFGAVDLYNLEKSRYGLKTNETYVKSWCIMGSGYYQMCLFNKNKIGWIPDDAIFRYSQDSYRLSLISINETTLGFRGVRVSSLNHSGYYLFEARAGIGVLVTFVDESIRPGYGIVDLVNVRGDRAYLREGETYHDRRNNFSLRVICETRLGFNISISNSVGQDVDESIFSYPISNKYFSDIDISESFEHLTYAAVERQKNLVNGFMNYVEVYRSYNYGRDWEFLYNTSIVGMNCSKPSISILNENPVLFVVSWNSSGIGFLEMFNDTVGNAFQRLEDLQQLRSIQTSSDQENSLVYVAWDDRNVTLNDIMINFGTWDGTNWNTSWEPVAHGSYPQMSPTSGDSDPRPFLTYKSGPDFEYVNLTRFGDTTTIHAWKNESIDTFTIWGHDVTCTNGNITIALHEYGWANNNYTDIIRIIKGVEGGEFEEVSQLEGFSDPQLFRINNSGIESIWLVSANRTDSYFTFFNITTGTLDPIRTSSSGEISVSNLSDRGLESVTILVRGYSSNIPLVSIFLFDGPTEPLLNPLSYFAYESDFTMNPIYFGVLLLCSLLTIPAIFCRVRILERIHKILNPKSKEWSMINWLREVFDRRKKIIIEEVRSLRYYLATCVIGYLALYVSVLLLPTRLLWSSTYLYYWHTIDIIPTVVGIVTWIIIPLFTIRTWNILYQKYSEFTVEENLIQH